MAKKTTKGAKKKAPKTKRLPKEQPLPGMEDVRDSVLSRIAAGVADERHTQASSEATEQSLLHAAQKRMQDKGLSFFRAHGVEFIRVPSDEKFRVRLVKGGGSEPGTEQPDADAAADGSE